MAVRSPRLRFSTPFVITMAAAVPLTAACMVRSTSNPPGPHTNPPGPTATNDHTGHEGHGRPPTQNPPGTDPATPTNPPTQNPPTGQTPEPTWNPPPPQPTTGGGGKPPVQNPPDTRPPTTNPTPNPPSTLPTHAATWTITKGSGDTCRAAMPVNCPKPQTPGGAVPTCNPPPPMAFACPPQMASTGNITVTRKAGETDCTVDSYFPDCPVNAKCAKKPSYRTACPTR